MKIQINTAPYLADDVWRYEVIAVFDKLIAFVHKPRDREWIILRNNSLAPRRYVDYEDTKGGGRLTTTSSDIPRKMNATTQRTRPSKDTAEVVVEQQEAEVLKGANGAD